MDPFRITRTYRSARRLQQVVKVFLRHGFGRVIDQIHLGRFIPFSKRLRTFGQWPPLKSPTTPERLRIAFGELGPTFIKLAQILSARPDLSPVPFADEFKKLQDEVPPEDFADMRALAEAELGGRLGSLFERFEPEPLAAAGRTSPTSSLPRSRRCCATRAWTCCCTGTRTGRASTRLPSTGGAGRGSSSATDTLPAATCAGTSAATSWWRCRGSRKKGT